MRIRRILGPAALFSIAAILGAHAETCALQQMASLDMTVLPDGRVAVPVTINGTPHEFMVDTAGVFSGLADDAAQTLGLKLSPIDTAMYGVGGKVKASSAQVDSFMLGRNEAKKFHLIVTGRKTDPATHVDGYLSADLLSLFDVEFDFSGKKMNLFSQDHCPGKVVYWTRSGFAVLPFHHTDHINFYMKLDGEDVSTDLDTGSSTTWLRHKAAVRIFGFDEKAPGVVRAPNSSDDWPIYQKQFALLQLGGVAVQNPMIQIISDHMEDAFRMEHSEKSRDDPIYGMQFGMEAFTLGMNVLSKLHLYIAYKEHKIYVTDANAH